MNQLVEIEGKKAHVSSRALSDGCGTQHSSVKRLIKEHEQDVTDINSLDLKSREFKTGGMQGTEYMLDEVQATFLMMLMKNSPIVTAFKKKLTKEFFKQRKVIAQLIAQQKDPSWQEIRGEGKDVHAQKSDVIKVFIEYAIAQGSKSAKMYYTNLAKMENSALFLFEQNHKNMREVLTIRQLMQVSTADQIIDKALKEGMDQALPYKDCYKLAKERIVSFAEIIGQSPILSLQGK